MVTKKFIDCSKNQQWLLCELIGALSKEDIASFDKNYNINDEPEVSIDIKVNGVECDFFVVTDEMFRQFDRIVQEAALKKVESTLFKLDDIIHDLQLNINEVKENIRKDVCQNLGLKYETREELY